MEAGQVGDVDLSLLETLDPIEILFAFEFRSRWRGNVTQFGNRHKEAVADDKPLLAVSVYEGYGTVERYHLAGFPRGVGCAATLPDLAAAGGIEVEQVLLIQRGAGEEVQVSLALVQEIGDRFGHVLGAHLQRFGCLDVRG